MCDLKAIRALLLAASLVLSGCGLDDDSTPKTPNSPQAAPLEAQTESLAGDQNPLINNQSADAGWAFYFSPASQTQNPHSLLNRIRCAVRDRMVTNPLKAIGASALSGAAIGLIALATQPSQDQVKEARRAASEYYEKLGSPKSKGSKAIGPRPENSLLPDNWFWTSAYSMRRWIAHPLAAAVFAGACQAAITGFWVVPTGLFGARFAALGAGLTVTALTMLTAAPLIRNGIHMDDMRYMKKYFPQGIVRNPVSISKITEAVEAWNFKTAAKEYLFTEVAPRVGVVALGALAGTAVYLVIESGSPYAKVPSYCPQDAPKTTSAETTKDSE